MRRVSQQLSTAFACLLVLASVCKGSTASWYGEEYRGRTMANGKPFNPDQLTCAHRSYPFGTLLRVSHGSRSVIVRVTDRGPFVAGREIDLSAAAFKRLGDLRRGLLPVTIICLSRT